jgi:PEP-CTERM motif
MFKVPGVPAPAGNRRAKPHGRLLQIAALVVGVMALASASADAAAINCVTTANDGSCDASGFYVGGAGEQSNTWKFFTGGTDSTLLYTLEISGTPVTTFSLDVFDFVVTQTEFSTVFEGPPPLSNFPTALCIPTFDEEHCGLFDVFATGEVDWVDGYLMTITWFANESPLSQPPDDGTNTILRAPDYAVYTETLADIDYDPSPTPTDPGMGGRGDGFSRFAAVTNVTTVPEPASLLLVGTGLGGFLYRSRRARRL